METIQKRAPDLDSQGRDRNDYARCAKCGVSALDKDLSLQPRSSVLIFGAFPGMFVPMESRCSKCEKKLSDKLMKMLDNLSERGKKAKVPK